jgi:hypothetical protein
MTTLSSQLNVSFGRYDLAMPIADLEPRRHLTLKCWRLGVHGSEGATLESLGRMWSRSVRVPRRATNRRHLGQVVSGRRLRRLRDKLRLSARKLCRVHRLGGAGAAAAGSVPQRLCRGRVARHH